MMQPSDQFNQHPVLAEAAGSHASSPPVPATWQDSDLDLLIGLWSNETQLSGLAELFTDLPASDVCIFFCNCCYPSNAVFAPKLQTFKFPYNL